MAIGKCFTTQCSQFFLRKGANDYTNRDSGGSTTSTSFVDINTLTFTPNGTADYAIFGNLTLGTATTNRSVTPRLYYDTGATAYGERTWYNAWTRTTGYTPWGYMFVLTGLSGEQTFKLQIKAETLNTAYWEWNQLTAICLSDFPAYNYAESLTASVTTNTTFTDKVTLSPTLPVDHPQWIVTNAIYRKGINAGYCEVQSVFNDRQMSLSIENPIYLTIDNTTHHSMRVIRPGISETTPTIKIQHRTQSTVTSGISDATILTVQLNDNPSTKLNGNILLKGNTRLR